MTSTNPLISPHEATRIENARRIALAMRAVGIESMQVEYSGSGDSGESWSVAVTPGIAFPKVEITTLHDLWDQATSMPIPSEVTHSLEEAFTDFAEAWIDEEHCGYENGDGGFGTITLNANGSAEFDHNDYIVETCNSSYSMEATAPEILSLPAAPALLMLTDASHAATAT